MKQILSILTLALVALCGVNTAQAQNYTTFTLLSHQDNSLALTLNTGSNALSFSALHTEDDAQATQRFWVQQQDNGTALIISVTDPSLMLKRSGSNVVIDTPDSDLNDFEWKMDYAGNDAADNVLLFFTDPSNPLHILSRGTDNSVELVTLTQSGYSAGTTAADNYRFRVAMVTNTF